MNIYVDESGNLGVKDRYFVIAMCRCDKPKRIKNFVSRFCARNNLPELKAAELPFSDKETLIQRLKIDSVRNITHLDYSISYIVLDKKQIRNSKLFNDKNVLYNYLFSFLIKKTLQDTKEDVHILFDNHTTKVKSINSLEDYLKIKAWTEWNFQNNLVVQYIDSKNSKCVQIADLIANSIYRKYNRGNSDLYDMLEIKQSVKFPFSTFGI